MRWKGSFNISEDFVSCTSLEFTPMAMASYLKKQTEKNRQKHDRATQKLTQEGSWTSRASQNLFLRRWGHRSDSGGELVKIDTKPFSSLPFCKDFRGQG